MLHAAPILGGSPNLLKVLDVMGGEVVAGVLEEVGKIKTLVARTLLANEGYGEFPELVPEWEEEDEGELVGKVLQLLQQV